MYRMNEWVAVGDQSGARSAGDRVIQGDASAMLGAGVAAGRMLGAERRLEGVVDRLLG